MNADSPVAELAALKPDRPLRLHVGDRVIAVFLLDGGVFALDDYCPHKGGPLGVGHCADGKVFCPLHGWGFDIKTGACDEVPTKPAKRIPVRVENGQIFLDLA